jgi:type IV secretion system protein VirB7
MIRTFPLLCMAAILSGCASMTYPLPKCDGYSRRPLNRAMWQWEDDNNLKRKHSRARPATSQHVAMAYVKEDQEPPAFAHLHIDASYRPCEG